MFRSFVGYLLVTCGLPVLFDDLFGLPIVVLRSTVNRQTSINAAATNKLA